VTASEAGSIEPSICTGLDNSVRTSRPRQGGRGAPALALRLESVQKNADIGGLIRRNDPVVLFSLLHLIRQWRPLLLLLPVFPETAVSWNRSSESQGR
jgi:hypothetical protein